MRQVTLTNTGGRPLVIASVALGGTNPGDFAIAYTSCAGNLVPSQTCVVGLTFKPTTTGARAASLTLTDDAAGSPQTVGLTGTGAVGNFTVTASAAGPGSAAPVDATSYAAGSEASYRAPPTGDAIFLGWTLDGTYVGYANPLTFQVNGDRTLKATFVARPAFSDVPTSDAAGVTGWPVRHPPARPVTASNVATMARVFSGSPCGGLL